MKTERTPMMEDIKKILEMNTRILAMNEKLLKKMLLSPPIITGTEQFVMPNKI